MLTVLTQTPAFVSGNRSEGYGHPDGPTLIVARFCFPVAHSGARLDVRRRGPTPCLLCGRKPSDPHHLRCMQPRALGRKVSDEFSVPLCRIHHRLVHRVGNEAAWWKEAGIDPVAVWDRTRDAEGRTRRERMHETGSHDLTKRGCRNLMLA
jgi:hypothetical protein